MNKLFSAALLFAFCLAHTSIALAEHELEGTWKLVQYWHKGEHKTPPAGAKVVLTENLFQYIQEGKDPKEQEVVRVDSSKSPKEADLKLLAGPNKGKLIRAIYALDGKTVKICMGTPGADRPTALESTADTTHVLHEWQRSE